MFNILSKVDFVPSTANTKESHETLSFSAKFKMSFITPLASNLRYF